VTPRDVLVIDDSPTLRLFTIRALEATGRYRVCGLSEDGRGAARLVARARPDVVVMDMTMPEVDGLEATRAIMSDCPRPIVLFCGLDAPDASRRAFEALAAGAVGLVPKPGPGTDLEATGQALVRALDEAVLAGLPRPGAARAARSPAAPGRPRAGPRQGLVAIGASTGGPPAVRAVLAALPADAPPVLVLQHIVPSFVESFARWLGGEVPQRVVVAQAGAAPAAGVVYLAPPGADLVLRAGRLDLQPGAGRHVPSVDVTFESIARAPGPRTGGVQLTGMGDDGARGLLALRRAGAATIAQDEATSVVYGMPRAARDLGAAEQVLPLDAIGPAVQRALADAPRAAGGRLRT
jgi:two-component system chemotaxis response regulator CheB